MHNRKIMRLQLKTWKTRFYVLTEAKLVFYKTQEDFHGNKLKGELDLSHMSRVQRIAPDAADGRESAFAVTLDKTHLFVAASEYEAAEWVRVLSLLLSINRKRATARSLISGNVVRVGGCWMVCDS